MDKTNTADFEGRMGRIEGLIHAIEGIANPDAKEIARELVQSLMELHGVGIERMLQITDATGPEGEPIIAGFAADPLVSNLLLVHGLHPVSLEARVMQALERVRPRLGQHGGSVELLGITDEGGIRLRLEGNCHGCPSSRVTLKYSIEEAIYEAAPDVTTIEVEGVSDDPVGAVATAGGLPKYTQCPTSEETGAILGKEQRL